MENEERVALALTSQSNNDFSASLICFLHKKYCLRRSSNMPFVDRPGSLCRRMSYILQPIFLIFAPMATAIPNWYENTKLTQFVYDHGTKLVWKYIENHTEMPPKLFRTQRQCGPVKYRHRTQIETTPEQNSSCFQMLFCVAIGYEKKTKWLRLP